MNDPGEITGLIQIELDGGGIVTVSSYEVMDDCVCYKGFRVEKDGEYKGFPKGTLPMSKLEGLSEKTEDEKILKFFELLGMAYLAEDRSAYLSQINL